MRLVPALLTRMSTGPPARSAIRSAASAAVTSIPSERATETTRAPSSSSSAATAAPIPRVAPVTTAVRPSIPRSMAAIMAQRSARRFPDPPGGKHGAMNPFDALLLPPALIKRALDDVHDIAQLVRRYADMEDEIRDRIALLEDDIGEMRAGIGALREELAGTRRAAEPLSAQMARLNEQLGGTRTAVEPLAG